MADKDVLGDRRKGDVVVFHVGDGSGVAFDGFDADTCCVSDAWRRMKMQECQSLPFTDLVTVEVRKLTPSTVLSSRPPTEPIERPWPPEQ
jgi:hypothetical protein